MLERLLKSFTQKGRLTVIRPDGTRFQAGDPATGPDIVVRIKGWETLLKLSLHPEYYLGEAYMNGDIVLEQGDIWDLLNLCGQNLRARRLRQWQQPVTRMIRSIAGTFQQGSTLWQAKKNVAHHYDLSEELFRLFLDEDMQYSCAYFDGINSSLNEAQCAKKKHIASKLLLKPDMHVLDIGSGWGGLAIFLARETGARVTGITLSQEQLYVARRRAEAAKLTDKVSFKLLDYRNVNGAFDRIVSVGMLEHVGASQYKTFFDKVTDLLTEDGVALIHSIGRADGKGPTNAWIRKYIFPGGYIPSLSQVLAAAERPGVAITDIEVLRLHYAETLRHWREKFLHNWTRIANMYDERFRRMWEFYLASCEMSFRFDDQMVFQLQLAKKIDAVPLTRDYIYDKRFQNDDNNR